jgi:DHA2 family multidrug resistance protein-like MFS transporter
MFQSPNNRQMLSSAPRERSGGASGMLGTARLTGQTIGAALVALIFGISPQHGPVIALTLAATVAGLASVVSFMRLRAPRTVAAT